MNIGVPKERFHRRFLPLKFGWSVVITQDLTAIFYVLLQSVTRQRLLQNYTDVARFKRKIISCKEKFI